MRVFWLIAFVGLSRSVCLGQATFNVVHNHSVEMGWPDAGGASGSSTWAVDSGYFVFAVQIETDNRGKPFTVFFDTTGVFQSERSFDLSPGQHFDMGYADPVETEAVPFSIGITEFDNPNDSLNRLHLFTFEGGDTLNTKLLYDSCWCGSQQTKPLLGGKVAMAGLVGLSGALFLTDTSGTMPDTTLYPMTTSALCLTSLVQGGFVVAGYQGGGVNDGVWVMRVDSAGNTIWRRNIGGSYHAYKNVSAIQTQDGGIVATCSWMVLPGSWNSPQWNYFRKWDIDGNVLWTEQYNQAQGSTAYDLEELPDGSLVACGNENTHWGTLMRLEPDGNLMWLRRYAYYQSNGSTHIPYDVEPTNDGGFVLTGAATQSGADSIPGLQMVWLLKVDSMGCLVPGCGWDGMEEVALGLENALSVYPNPATNQLTVKLDLPANLQAQGSLRLVVVDALGRTVLEEALGRQTPSTTLNLEHLAPGVHYVHLRDERRWLAGTKLVVE